MTLVPSARPHRTRWLIGIAAVLLAVFAFSASPALVNAAFAASSPPVDPTTAKQSMQVWIRLDSDKSGVPNVNVQVTGANGFDQTVITGADGKVLIGFAKSGTYTVTIDEKSLPAGAGFPNQNPRKVEVFAQNTEVPANFLVSPANSAIGASTPPGPSGGTANETSAQWWGIFWSKVVTGLIFGLLLALAAIGLSLIYGTTGLNNFAHGELVTFGALMAYTFSGILRWPAWIAIILAVVLGGVFGYVQNQTLWRPLRKRNLGLIPLMIVTIGLSLALRYVFVFFWGSDRLTLPNSTKPFLVIGSISLKFTDVAGAVVAILLLLGVAYVLLRTKIGKATRAVADNRSLAAASGIDVEGVIRTVWIGGAALAALAGVFVGYYQSLRWDTGASILLLIFAAVVLGGLGTAFGALIGSIVIGVFINVSTIWIPENLKYVAALVVMILILLFRPQGILGRRDRVG
ncbi:branched-chain amino acid ABC transporter permease [Frigoribacterium sp. CG_9.8]|uniref:branched-chain amino acid ABC transporter permease n=1 Tax=Frigoribacterium sp. CG_9.8 TaxID=2787733 RepID=UPI001A33B021|nr:branched-chain amino acid transport system permease protein [Frigoribacterium sp. CG_9.8]